MTTVEEDVAAMIAAVTADDTIDGPYSACMCLPYAEELGLTKDGVPQADHVRVDEWGVVWAVINST